MSPAGVRKSAVGEFHRLADDVQNLVRPVRISENSPTCHDPDESHHHRRGQAKPLQPGCRGSTERFFKIPAKSSNKVRVILIGKHHGVEK